MLKSPAEIMRMLENKSNWIGEYEIVFKKYENRSDLSVSGYMKYNSQNNYNRDAFTTKCFYDNFLEKKSKRPLQR